ncbi:helix-turn-helix domain-containing protein [Halorarius halobius]|uniref:helix-turn-helix domain-containing protein n=1 Tax=Halorarius halobius TaxID=2962671 RepID=UPI0020CF4189|nr:helix-turn-helix domain-containing protein [Halorarius halobius]
MKYLRLTLRVDSALRHPVHQRIGESDEIDRDLLLAGNTATDGWDTLLFYVEGDRGAYRDALEATDRVAEYELTEPSDGGFYAYLKDEGDPLDELMFEAFSRTGLVLVPPVEFFEGGRATLTVLGDPDRLQELLDDLPDGVDATVDRIGEYDERAPLFDPGLTSRQREAVAAAVDAGYYEVPRSGTVADVADRIGCAAGTADEHLRKAERAVMRELVTRGAGGPA